MGRLTHATDAQKAAVSSMVTKMMNPTVRPEKTSYTFGWDVVASYSEKQINQLLADRHKKDATKMLQDIAIDVESYDPRTDENYNAHYRLKFGPPLLQFDARATGEPMCSIRMVILSGTEQQGDGAKVKDMTPGWSLQLHNIPLASAAGVMSEGGEIQSKGDIVRGDKYVEFNYHEKDQRHVVLGFHMAKEKLVVEAIPPEGLDPSQTKTVLQRGDLQQKFKDFFIGDGKRALSYSIASVNNASDPNAIELTPEKFQFATFAAGAANTESDVRVLSIFIQVRGGSKAGRSESLQSSWQAQWVNNGIQPIPKGFTAGLILSSHMIHNVLLKEGFKKSKWTTEDQSGNDEALNRISARSSEHWIVPEQNHGYGKCSNFHVEGFDLALDAWPMKLEIRQEDANKAPTAYVYWEIKRKVHYKSSGTAMLVEKDHVWAEGDVNTTYRLCDGTDFSKYRKMDCNILLTDEAFDLDLKLKTTDFRMDQSEGNAIQFETWEKGMKGLWTKAPTVSISSIGLGFFRTTNLLSPGKEVIDFNEGIGLKAPKDFLLFGDILKE